METIKKKVVLLFLIFLVFPLVSADLTISKPETTYNFGDPFKITIKANPPSDTSSFLTAELICAEHRVEIYKSPYSIKRGEEKVIEISTNLDNFLVEGFQGNCHILASFADEQASSKAFELTKEISVSININKILFNPGDTLSIYGRADKTMGALTGGSIELSIPEMFSPTNHKIINGEYNINLTIPDDAGAGDYNVLVKAVERDSSGALLNEGIAESLIKVKQILKSIEIALDAHSVIPGNELTYKALAYDQARNLIYSDISLILYQPDGTELTQKLLRTDETSKQSFEKNSPPGNWILKATLEDFEVTKEILVEDLEELAFILNPDQTLTLTNIGNVPYNGPIEITIGEVSRVKEITDLPLGESKTFRLEAPDGNYDIIAGTGEAKQILGTTFLTGNAISVDDVGRTLKENAMVLIWIVLILIIAIMGLIIYRKVSKKGFIGKAPPTSQTSTSSELSPKTKEEIPVSHIIDKGEKQEASIISVKIKNATEITSDHEALKAIDSALWKAKESKAKIYAEGEHRVIVFAPILTKEKDNTVKALLISQTIERILNEFNKRHMTKIQFGIGVHIGNLIVEKKEGKFKFISVNNTISAAKRLAQHADNNILMSEDAHRSTIGKVKTLKLINQNYWKLLKVTDRSQHADYVRNFVGKNSAYPAKSRFQALPSDHKKKS